MKDIRYINEGRTPEPIRYRYNFSDSMRNYGLQSNDMTANCLSDNCYDAHPKILIYMRDSENADFYAIDYKGNLAKVGQASGGYKGAIQYLEQQGISSIDTFRFWRQKEDNPYYRLLYGLPPQQTKPQSLPNQWNQQQFETQQKPPEKPRKKPCRTSAKQAKQMQSDTTNKVNQDNSRQQSAQPLQTQSNTNNNTNQEGSRQQSSASQQHPSIQVQQMPPQSQQQQIQRIVNEVISKYLRRLI